MADGRSVKDANIGYKKRIYLGMGRRKMKDGIIELDSEFAKEIGFTSDKFDGWLWIDRGCCVLISLIVSKQRRQGNLSNLFNAILSKGFDIKVPTPTNMMKAILLKKGFIEYDWYWIKHAETSIDAVSANIIDKEGK